MQPNAGICPLLQSRSLILGTSPRMSCRGTPTGSAAITGFWDSMKTVVLDSIARVALAVSLACQQMNAAVMAAMITNHHSEDVYQCGLTASLHGARFMPPEETDLH